MFVKVGDLNADGNDSVKKEKLMMGKRKDSYQSGISNEQEKTDTVHKWKGWL